MFPAARCVPIHLADITIHDLAETVTQHMSDSRFAVGRYGERRRRYGVRDADGRLA